MNYDFYPHNPPPNKKKDMHLPPNTVIFLFFPSSFKLSPKLFLAVTTNSYLLPFSNLTATSRTETLSMTFTLFHCLGIPSSLTVLWYTVYCVMGAPLFCGSFHFIVTSVSFVSAGNPFISAAAGNP